MIPAIPNKVIGEVKKFIAIAPPQCSKSSRVAVIFLDGGDVISIAQNGPPRGFRCGYDAGCREVCNRVAVHAEERAIIRAAGQPSTFGIDLTPGKARVTPLIEGASMLHARFKDGQIFPSGPPSCWQCSRMIADSGISWMWLLRINGWERWSSADFHEATLRECGLPQHPNKEAN